ncbi:MAG TPA: haloacid dehalogenase type II [Terriglobales bacterium]|jgi:2-haloacid dehalogenase
MLNFDQIRLITFDCYGTLIDWETGILDTFRPILSTHGAHLSDSEILRLYGEIEAEEESGEYRQYKDVLRAVVRSFGGRMGFTPSNQEQQSLPDSLPDWKPFPDTVAALRRLKRKFQLGIISNIDDDLFSATAPKLEVDFDFVVTATQARAYKPSHRVFELAQSRMPIAPQQWLHAAQSVYHDVVPGKTLGLSTVWVNRPSRYPNVGAVKSATAKPDLEVSSLGALADLTTY